MAFAHSRAVAAQRALFGRSPLYIIDDKLIVIYRQRHIAPRRRTGALGTERAMSVFDACRRGFGVS